MLLKIKQSLKQKQTTNPLTKIAKPTLIKNTKAKLPQENLWYVFCCCCFTCDRFFIFPQCFCRVLTFLGFLVRRLFYCKSSDFDRVFFILRLLLWLRWEHLIRNSSLYLLSQSCSFWLAHCPWFLSLLVNYTFVSKNSYLFSSIYVLRYIKNIILVSHVLLTNISIVLLAISLIHLAEESFNNNWLFHCICTLMNNT